MERAQDKTILIVDDEPDVRQYLRAILVDAGFNVVTAIDGLDALSMIRQKRPDFISLDLLMPRKSGLKLLYELKKDKQLSRIPVLIVTAHAEDELGEKDLNELLEDRVLSGPQVYLEKPIKPLTYVRSIQRALGIEESEEAEEKMSLKEKMLKQMKNASPEALQKALAALKNKH